MYKNFSMLSNKIPIKPRTIVVAAAHDSHTLEAIYNAAKLYHFHYILVGNREKIVSISSDLGFSPKPEDIIEGTDNEDCARLAVDLIKNGHGNVLMKGILETGTLLKAVLNKEAGVRGSGTLSHLVMLEVPGYHKLIGLTDGGMIPNPDLTQKADIIRNAAAFFNNLGYECPKIAALCASETVSEKIRETVEASKLQAMCKEGLLGDCIVEGPISFDLAISKESALIKGFSSDISGETDILLVPDITTGNVLVKGLVYWANAKMAGVVIGAKAPIVLASRAASAEEKLLSIMISITG